MKKDLLIIERNTRDSLTSLLAEEGYSICLAETAAAGLEALKRHKITHTVVLNGYFCISPQKGIFQIRKTLFGCNI